jgi:2-oxoglutarate ferredoxin oxidoreductase subunit alpha
MRTTMLQSSQTRDPPKRALVDGASAIVQGALAAGCTFFAGYPITPASSILMMMLRELPKVGGVGIQAEDEIASLGMCIGAAMAGARAMTATSGPGISLYSENLGLAIMGEVPLVIVDVQRMGPATGGATTTAQGDVQFIRWGTGGGYPVIALAPSTVAESYSLTVRAFDLAERFRCPVFLLTDKELNLTRATVRQDEFDAPLPRPRARREINSAQKANSEQAPPYQFQPPDGVSTVAEYGDGAVLRFTGSTHDESAYITKDRPTIDRLNRHLAAKIDMHIDEIEMVDADLQPGARLLVLSYGTTAGAAREAVRIARDRGVAVSSVTVHSLWPVPRKSLCTAFSGVETIVLPELNLGLYLREINRIAEGRTVRGIQRVDGGLISPQEILEALS